MTRSNSNNISDNNQNNNSDSENNNKCKEHIVHVDKTDRDNPVRYEYKIQL